MNTLVRTARLNRADPEAYLAYVLDHRLTIRPIRSTNCRFRMGVPSLLSTARVELIQ
ncbi:hypothetical protein DF146_19505 [Burkholderia cenocepacia]|nr:hypothetical protein DF165_14275 [Burkholderia cenocepacia]RQU51395.1 hypothetical protein DF146_19505 [Burkholderia cenocepacia]